jgi:hypothetical protein
MKIEQQHLVPVRICWPRSTVSRVAVRIGSTSTLIRSSLGPSRCFGGPRRRRSATTRRLYSAYSPKARAAACIASGVAVIEVAAISSSDQRCNISRSSGSTPSRSPISIIDGIGGESGREL